MTSTLGGLVLELRYAAVTGKPWINVNYLTFRIHRWSLSVWLILLTLFLRRRRLLRPPDAPILSWENWLYTLVRWPYIARGIFSAVINWIYPRPVTFKVTPKGTGGPEPLPTRLMVPYIVISCGSAAAALVGEANQQCRGVRLPLHRGRVRILASVHHRARPARAGVGAAKRCADLVRATPHQPAAAFGRSYIPAAGTDRGSALSVIRAARFSYVTELYLIFYPASPRGIILAIIVTGGAGFIGSHTCVELRRRGKEVIVVDNYSNSSPAALTAIREVSGGES